MSTLNYEEVENWKQQWAESTQVTIEPILGSPPGGMYHSEYKDAPVEIVLGYKAVYSGTDSDKILYTFSENTNYITPMRYGS